VLAGLALIGVAIFGALLLLAEDDDGEEAAPERAVTTAPPPEPGESLEDTKTGISVNWPSDWDRREKNGTYAFRSPDEKLVLSISAPAPARDADELRKGAIESIREEYDKATVLSGKGRTIGGLPAAGALIKATQRSGAPLRILVAVAQGRQRAYLLEVISATDTPPGTLAEGQAILASIQLKR
jgi:hypothetical protein